MTFNGYLFKKDEVKIMIKNNQDYETYSFKNLLLFY